MHIYLRFHSIHRKDNKRQKDRFCPPTRSRLTHTRISEFRKLCFYMECACVVAGIASVLRFLIGQEHPLQLVLAKTANTVLDAANQWAATTHAHFMGQHTRSAFHVNTRSFVECACVSFVIAIHQWKLARSSFFLLFFILCIVLYHFNHNKKISLILYANSTEHFINCLLRNTIKYYRWAVYLLASAAVDVLRLASNWYQYHDFPSVIICQSSLIASIMPCAIHLWKQLHVMYHTYPRVFTLPALSVIQRWVQ